MPTNSMADQLSSKGGQTAILVRCPANYRNVSGPASADYRNWAYASPLLIILFKRSRLTNFLYSSSGGYISVQKLYLFPPPFWNWYFSPSCETSILDSHRGPFALILPYFAFILPFFSFSFPFLPFSFTFSPFFSSPFHIFPPKWHRLIFSPGGGGIFQYIDPCSSLNMNNISSI